MFNKIVNVIKSKFPDKDFIPLHEPTFGGNEKRYLNECIDSTFVSSVGKFVNRFEEEIVEYTGAKYAVATVNGTNALQIALVVAGVERGDEVITQALSFIATANAISYCGASPIFVDVDKSNFGLSPKALNSFLETNAEIKVNGCFNKTTGNRIAACVPMHTYGFPCRIDEIQQVCIEWNIILVEDSAESLGSFYKGKHTGTFGKLGIFSFNGNKTITSGGGGVIITDDESSATLAKHLTAQAKVPHSWEFRHDHIGYNFRMPNLNAALACAQLEQLELFIEKKRALTDYYAGQFADLPVTMLTEHSEARSNQWLNTLMFATLEDRNKFLKYSNSNGVMTRPAWELLNTLPMFDKCQTDNLSISQWAYQRLVNIPSTVIL
jgi:perosamine synthetase